jgi:hypothetical protein
VQGTFGETPLEYLKPCFLGLPKIQHIYKGNNNNAKKDMMYATVQATLTVLQVDKVIERYIQKYVLCPFEHCRLPEWDVKLKQCRACGYVKPKSKSSKHKKIEPVVEHETEEPEKQKEETKEELFNKEVCQVMHQLYDRRQLYKSRNITTVELDDLLDKCWALEDMKKWRHIKGRAEDVLGIGITKQQYDD